LQMYHSADTWVRIMRLKPVHVSTSAFPEKAGVGAPTALVEPTSMRQSNLQDYECGGLTCPECGNTYSGRFGLSKHHNAQHGEKFLPLAACDNCGDLYQETPGNIYASSNTYCSEKCRKAAFRGRTPPNREPRETLSCDECGDSYEVREGNPENRRFCCDTCYFDWQRGRQRSDGPPEHICEWCGDTFERYASPSRSEPVHCSVKCASAAKAQITGEDHPLYTGGTDYYRAVRRGLSETGWRTERKQHLGDGCELCGDSDVTLALHHIVPVLSGGTNAAYNYMTLCRSCHSTVESYTNDLPGMEAVLTE